jgi:YfiH family protein
MSGSALATLRGVHKLETFASFSVTAAFSDRALNMRFAEDLPPGESGRQAFCEALSIPPQDLVCLEQIHGANIVLAGSEMKGRGSLNRVDAVPRADGIISRERGIPLGVLTADCASVFFFDPRRQTVGMAHIGWRGAMAGLAEKMVAAFHNNFVSRPRDLHVALGPMIRPCCYEVGEEVASCFPGSASKRKGRIFLDLPGVIRAALVTSGVPKTHIEDSGFCTACQTDLFYSYRREGASCGRMLSVIMMPPVPCQS